MNYLTITAVALAAAIGAPVHHARAQESAARPAAGAAGGPLCYYQDQRYSEGAVLNGRVCARNKAAAAAAGGRAEGRAAELVWAPLEKAELSGMQQDIERTRLQTQLVQARTVLAETEARQAEAMVKLSGKN